MKSLSLLLFATALFSSPSIAQNLIQDKSDLYLAFTKCESLISPIYSVEEDADQIKSVKTDSFVVGCKKQESSYFCKYYSKPTWDKPFASRTLLVVKEIPILYLATDGGAEILTVNLKQGTCVSLTRIVLEKGGQDPGILGSKVCYGYYLTHAEISNLVKGK